MPSFPYRLHALLETAASDEELSSIISWLPDGKSFRLHSEGEFEKIVMKRYFPRQSQVKSFKRQLQYYDFENFGDGLFSHPCFVRGKRNLCGKIVHQVPTKWQKVGGATIRPPKTRGRKRKSRSSSLTSTSSSSGSLKSRILKAAARDAASPVSVIGSDSSSLQAEPSQERETNIPKFVVTVQNKRSPAPRSDTPPPASTQKGMMTPTVVLSANNMLSHQHLVQMQAMQEMAMRQQRYLICLQEQEDLMLRSILHQNNGNNGLVPPSSIFPTAAGHELLLPKHQRIAMMFHRPY